MAIDFFGMVLYPLSWLVLYLVSFYHLVSSSFLGTFLQHQQLEKFYFFPTSVVQLHWPVPPRMIIAVEIIGKHNFTPEFMGIPLAFPY